MTELRFMLPNWLETEIDRQRIYADDCSRMQLAIHLAQRNVENSSGGPFGAAIFSEEGVLIATGVNLVVAHNCSVAHAEMMTFMQAQAYLQRCRLNENGTRMILATSAQPCCMCYGALFWAGIDEILIGARAEDVHELTDFDEGPLPNDWMGELVRRGINVKRDIERETARGVLAQYAKQGGTCY